MPYSAGTAYLTVVPSFLNIERAFRKEAENLGREVDKAISKSVPGGMREGAREARREGERAGEAYAGAFATAVRRRLEAALKAMPKVEIDADSTPAERAIHEIRADLETLRDAKIGVDLTEEEFFREVARVQAAAARLDHESISIEIRTNARAVAAELEALGHVGDSARTRSAQERAARERGAREGSQYGGAFETAARRRLEAASHALGRVDLDINASGVDRELLEIRRRIESLSHTDIDIDIPAHEWMGELGELEAALRAISENAVNIRIKTNARQALAEITALRAATEGDKAEDPAGKGAKDGAEYGGAFATAARNAIKAALTALPEVHLNADSSDVDREIASIRARLATMSNLDIGVDIDAATANAEITRIEARLRELAGADPRIDVHTNLLATAAELAALQAMVNRLDGQDIDIHVDTHGAEAGLLGLAESAGLSMSRIGALISVGVSLGTALVPAAATAAAAVSSIAVAAAAAGLGVGVLALGLFGVIKAVGAMDKAQKGSEKSAVSVSAAQARVANALDSVANAASSVENAQRGLARAERDRKQAVEELSKAQEEARRQLEDMALAVRSNALAQRQARLDEAQAKQELDKILANPRATQAEREQARITFEQRILQLDELTVQQKRLAADKAEADRKGVAGSDKVAAAQERILNATESVAAAQQSLVQSQRALVQSQRALAQAYQKTDVAGGAALQNLQQAMDALSPAGQRFARFIFGLKDEFKKLQFAAEEGLLPGLQQAIQNLLPFLPAVERLVGRVANALGGIFVKFSESLKDPIWQRFFGYIADTAVPALQGMFQFAENVAKGIAGIILGLSGFNAPIGEGLLKWSEGFAKWGETLDNNKGWQNFLAYVREVAPHVIDFFKQLWDFTKSFVIAAAPIGDFVVRAFAQLFEWLNKIDPTTMTVIVAAIAGIGAALLVVAGITAAIGTGIAGAIIAAVAVVGAGLVILYQKVKPFRDAVDTTIKAIADSAMALWQNVLKPTFDGIVVAVGVGIDAFNTLYDQIFVHQFALINAILMGFWQTTQTVFGQIQPFFPLFGQIASAAFAIFVGAIRISAAIFGWFWDHVLSPIFGFIGAAFEIFKAVFQVAFGLFQIGVKLAAAPWIWFYQSVIAPVIEKLRPLFAWLGEVIARDVAPPFKAGLELLGKAWDILVQATKVPLRFIVQTLLNDGLLAGYNKIAKFFKVKPDDVHIDLPKGFARGGAVYGPGTTTSDSILARLSRNEHIWTAEEVQAAGGHGAVAQLRQAVLAGVLPGFKDGGAVGGDIFSKIAHVASGIFGGIKDFFTDPAGTLRSLLNKIIDVFPDKAVEAVQVALGMPKTILDLTVDKVKNLFNLSGPGGDSGPGFPPWPASPAAQRGDSGVWRSIVALIRSTGPISGAFGNAYRAGDPLWHGSGRAVDWMGFNQDALATFLTTRRPLELIHRSNARDYAYTRGVNKGSFHEALMQEHRNHVHIAMDAGGFLPAGYSSIFNGTGRPEPVLTGQQWRDINVLAQAAGDAATPTYNFEFKDTTLTPGKLRAMQDADAARARVGRAR